MHILFVNEKKTRLEYDLKNKRETNKSHSVDSEEVVIKLLFKKIITESMLNLYSLY